MRDFYFLLRSVVIVWNWKQESFFVLFGNMNVIIIIHKWTEKNNFKYESTVQILHPFQLQVYVKCYFFREEKIKF